MDLSSALGAPGEIWPDDHLRDKGATGDCAEIIRSMRKPFPARQLSTGTGARSSDGTSILGDFKLSATQDSGQPDVNLIPAQFGADTTF